MKTIRLFRTFVDTLITAILFVVVRPPNLLSSIQIDAADVHP
ncbi:MAG: hypothetical protein VX589_18240 [Myxococcota bacterium]|nr:hypothetical protein [Myxococcota bacterium]